MFFSFGKKKRPEGITAAYIPVDRELRIEKRARRTIFRWALLFFVIFLGAAAVLIKAPVFYVKEMIISGNRFVSKEAVAALALSRVGSQNFLASALGVNHFFNWPERFPAEKLRFLPELKAALVEKDYGGRSVLIRVEEREPYGIWCQESQINNDCWWFDSEGVIFRKAVRAEGSLIFMVADHSRGGLGLGTKVLPENFLPNLFSALGAVRVSGLRVREIALEDLELQEIVVKTYDGPRIYFSLRFPATNTLAALNNLMSKSGFKDLEYVDFRVENRVYYK